MANEATTAAHRKPRDLGQPSAPRRMTVVAAWAASSRAPATGNVGRKVLNASSAPTMMMAEPSSGARSPRGSHRPSKVALPPFRRPSRGRPGRSSRSVVIGRRWLSFLGRALGLARGRCPRVVLHARYSRRQAAAVTTRERIMQQPKEIDVLVISPRTTPGLRRDHDELLDALHQ